MTKVNNTNKPLVIAQFSDSHLFASIDGLHHGANVYQNLQRALHSIASNDSVDFIIFTGDLSQDHSEQSYRNFVSIVQETKLSVPVYYLAGNHDEPALLEKFLVAPEFCSEKTINTPRWQIHILDSKSETPAGFISHDERVKLKTKINNEKFQLLMMHHHPVDVGYFIDRHGLTNQNEFWHFINDLQKASVNIKAIACGHVHRASYVEKYSAHPKQSVGLFTCPATSIAFDPSKDTVSALDIPPSYRIIKLNIDGTISSDIISV
jgi:Icc protein